MTEFEPRLPAVGHPAPDFTLPSTGGSDITLSSFRGQADVVLAFFPLAFTRVCTAELCSFTEDVPRFAHVNAEVLGISVDSVPTLQAFREKHDIEINLLSDFQRSVCRRYGTLMEDQFFSSRAYIIIDKLGVVRWTFAEAELGDRRENDELLGHLDALT